MDNIIVRQATIQDAEYISLLGRITFAEAFGYLFRDEQDVIDHVNDTFAVAKIRVTLQDPNIIYLLAFYNELPAGYVKLFKDSPSPFITGCKVSELQKIYVLKDFLAQKIGQHLIDAAISELQQQNTNCLWLSVFVDNERALRFYKKNGFTAVGQHSYGIGKESFNFHIIKKELF